MTHMEDNRYTHEVGGWPGQEGNRFTVLWSNVARHETQKSGILIPATNQADKDML